MAIVEEDFPEWLTRGEQVGEQMQGRTRVVDPYDEDPYDPDPYG